MMSRIAGDEELEAQHRGPKMAAVQNLSAGLRHQWALIQCLADNCELAHNSCADKWDGSSSSLGCWLINACLAPARCGGSGQSHWRVKRHRGTLIATCSTRHRSILAPHWHTPRKGSSHGADASCGTAQGLDGPAKRAAAIHSRFATRARQVRPPGCRRQPPPLPPSRPLHLLAAALDVLPPDMHPPVCPAHTGRAFCAPAPHGALPSRRCRSCGLSACCLWSVEQRWTCGRCFMPSASSTATRGVCGWSSQTRRGIARKCTGR